MQDSGREGWEGEGREGMGGGMGGGRRGGGGEMGRRRIFFFFKVQGLGCFAHVRKGGMRTPL